jgi:hypothetical protein
MEEQRRMFLAPFGKLELLLEAGSNFFQEQATIFSCYSTKKKQRGFTKDYNAHHPHKETGKNRKREKLRTTHVIPLFSSPVPSSQLRPPLLQLSRFE